ncbi:MAG: PIG-L family deacetylase [Silicimonas sp.]|nr:PIG-L family deacetylase [Silicimonas sp.]
MATEQQRRITEDRARPRIIELWWALRPLRSTLRFMQTGAHPDDEISGMLAALAFRDGINLSYACSTRGEGGQNDIGRESGAALGALRTREMERACDVLGMRMYWHSETPDDTITDFGFSKSGEETLARWGHARTLKRFVEILRLERPDIICPTFLDVPGQHGHHRAMTQAAAEAMRAAADPDYPCDLPPWQVKKLYLPAWSGAGQAYDDDLPPPPATLVIPGDGADPVSGWDWERIGQQSRACHRTQGMGRWVAAGTRRDWPLHLAETILPGPDDSLGAGLPTTLADLATLPGAATLAEPLNATQAQIDRALAAFPETAALADAALAALPFLRAAREACPEAAAGDILHRLDAKETQLSRVAALALGVEARAWAGDAFLNPGDSTALHLESHPGQAEALDVTLDLPEGWSCDAGTLHIAQGTRPGDPYRAAYDPAAPDAPALTLRFTHQGVGADISLPMDRPPVVLPTPAASITPDAVVLNLTRDNRRFSARLQSRGPADLDLPPGWHSDRAPTRITGKTPDDLAEGLHVLPLLDEGRAAQNVQMIDHPHVDPTHAAAPATLRLLALRVELPEVKLAYIGGGNDRVGGWLSALGLDVTDLSEAGALTPERLAAFDTIVIGIFALRFRPGLADALPALHAWTRAGGTLVTLYHRPWDNWDPATTGLASLEIGQPSLRYRVTDESAEIHPLTDHPVLAGPNPIGPEDWGGWVKERGLYFAKSWDAAYTPLIELADPGEAPHRGALLSGRFDAGCHRHCALILHHQMDNLVPGAFRLMANLITPEA